jgi:hypothetical protein
MLLDGITTHSSGELALVVLQCRSGGRVGQDVAFD